ncbi:metal-dependent hydrolase [Frankia sp. CNm7]|uniref:Metal-dependent hydrolase n=1 Tax=Frankia nepalensis TaxID=1836974 RepID=A0A937RNX9_9ACTN|nr:metal-dependent hydrolase [Frankia nepalensis]MBL7498475.1 metal-dependent hydrolase [Frankia nepalensis]MBL7509496.1 metal-dependent hydrolase [Frankia nepalensis]MBL7520755.1 metal-dependent hydrolase [Frankia nepalensis]MBL7629306.1 metal-dependent hydrolase [Frankia nepalensis]
MTTLQVRRVPFDFAADVPFLWNPERPDFSLQMNATSIIAIAFEKYIVAAMKEAIPQIADADAAAEADVFLRQEAQHASAHRQHMRALIRTYPGLQGTLDGALALYDELLETRPLKFHLAYIADLESAFTPTFKLFLDHEDVLFRPGDDRVASLFLWHFTEEVEHRSSGLRIYRALGGEAYRLRALPRVVRHLNRLITLVAAGFNEHVPFEDRKVDARTLVPAEGFRLGMRQKLRLRRGGAHEQPPAALDFIPKRERRAAGRRVLLAQLPGHDPEHQPLPAFVGTWQDRYDAGAPVATWYSSSASA